MQQHSTFKPAWWLPGPHLQTIWPVLFRRRPALIARRERLELPDGDFLDIDWIGNNSGPIVLVLHGLEGSIHSHYAGSLLQVLDKHGFRPLLMHFRGCSEEPNRLPRGYHSGDTGDLNQVLELVKQNTGATADAIIGFSLGGNVLLKWLGEQAGDAGITTAIAISVPFMLNDCALRLEQGASRFYRDYLLRKLRTSYKKKFVMTPSPLEVDVDQLCSFRDFDHYVTAPLHGFDSVDDYYSKSSSKQYLKLIETPTLLLHAADDPFMLPATVPGESELSPSITLEISKHGGHVGFVQGAMPWRAKYWLEERIIQHLKQLFSARP